MSDIQSKPGRAPHEAAGRPVYQVLSLLLSYPEQALIDLLPELRASLDRPGAAMLQALFRHLGEGDLIGVQEQYVATFDRRAAHSLHLFEHVHGESRDRGQAMVDLLQEYRRHGLEPSSSELPDYVPVFLEFLAQIPPGEAEALLGDAIHVLARVGDKLAEAGSPYAGVFSVLRTLTGTEPEPLPEPPEGEMEETMVTFGPSAYGVEPALRVDAQGGGARPVQFYSADGTPRTLSSSRARP